MSKIGNIVTGWCRALGIISIPDTVEALSKKRLAKCDECPAAKYAKFLDIVNGNVEEVHAKFCTKCHCPCLEKSLVPSETCPLGRW